MSNFKTIIIVLAVLLMACYLSIEYSKIGYSKGNSKGTVSSNKEVLNKDDTDGNPYKKYEDLNGLSNNIPDKVQDVCHNVPLVDTEDCYKQLYPITLPYVDYKSNHIPPAFADSPCIF